MKLRELLAKATPGPWLVEPDERPGMQWNNHIVEQSGNAICFMAHSGSPDNSTYEANAELIAYLRNHAEAYVALEEAARPFTNYINKTTERIPTESDWLAFGKALRELEKP